MRRAGALAVAVVMLIVLGQLVVAAESRQDILVARNSTLAVIDANDNGSLDDWDDCVLNASIFSDGSGLVIKGTQGDGLNKLRVCDGKCYGSAFLDDSSDEVEIRSCDYAGAPFVPMLADFCPSLSHCLENNNSTMATGGTAGLPPPLNLTAGVIFRELTEFRAGFGQVCSNAGPAVQITGDDGVTVLRELETTPDGKHMCVHDVPVQLVSDGFVFRTACFPVSDGKSEFSLSGDPDRVLSVIDFVALPPCGAVRGAPTVSEWGLIALMVALLGLGTWALGRRRSFYEAVRLP